MAMRALLPFLLLLASASSLAVDYSSKSVLLVSGLSSDDDAAFLLRLLEEEGQGRMRRFDVKPISPGEDTVLAVEQEGREDVIRALEVRIERSQWSLPNMCGPGFELRRLSLHLMST